MSSSFVTNSNHLIDLNSGANTLSITGAVVITGNLSVTGNATLSGNILGDKIQNGASNVNIATANGNITVTANTGNIWTFSTGGNLVFPSNLIIDNESPNTRIYMASGSLKMRAQTTASLKLGWDEFTGASANGSLAHVIANGGGSEQPANLVVLTGNSSSTTYQWVFGAGGNLSAPGNISAVGNITGNYFIGNGSQLTSVSTSFDLEMHVSKDGNDSTGTGTILRPYLTITHALTQVAGGRNTIVIHPGGYTENPTITSLATQLITYDATGASTLILGTVTIANTTGRIAGLKMSNLAITGNAQAYINSSTVDEQFTKSSSGYVEVDDCELQATGNVLISGSGIITITGNKIANLVVNNAGASVLVKGATDCLMPQVTAGSLNIVDSTIRASSNTANAVTASAGTVVTLMNNQIVTPAADNVARVSIAGFHSIISLVYDKANSTLSNSLNSVVYFQTANVDSLVSSGNVTGGNISTAGVVKTGVFVTGTIPTATGVGAGARAFVTDADSVTFGNLYTGGSGNAVPVYSNGTSWFVG
jgi:hypothetical protein